MDERVWRLPGPRGFIREVVTEHRRGRHVVTVLPQTLESDPLFTDSLAVAILDEFTRQSVSAHRVYPTDDGGSLLETFSRALVFDDPPATIPDLLNHPDTRDMAAVVVASDMGTGARSEFPGFLRRIQVESQAGDMNRRLTIIAIVARAQLPGFAGGASSDAAMASSWWWGRIARYDVAAHVADLAGHADLPSVLADVRTETIVEVARWDLDLAEHLAAAWAGDPADLPALLKAWRTAPMPLMTWPRSGTDLLRPPESLLGSWDERAVESWHHSPSIAGCSLADEPEKLNRVVWAAQARVLLPWIEERRATLHDRVTGMLGAQRLESLLRDGSQPPARADALVEIGMLDKIVQRAIGSTDIRLRDASRRLRDARNALAHMRPLSLGEQASLVAACQYLL